jgi:hypothetical protein
VACQPKIEIGQKYEPQPVRETMNFNLRLTVLIVLSLLVLSGFVSVSGARIASASSTSPTVSKPVFIWMFGYTGNSFYPQSQLGLSQAQTISVAQQVSARVGKTNLRIVCALGLEGGSIGSGSYTAERNYVNSLKQYASVVYARMDLQDYSGASLMSNIGVLVKTLGVNGLWLDEAPKLWASMGSARFNTMMQNIVNAFPSINIILNQALIAGSPIRPTMGTWGSHTWIAPSVNSGGCCTINYGEMSMLNGIWGGRVVLHFDAFAKVNTEPMGIFANQQTSTEESEIRSLAGAAHSHNFDFLFPVLGAWTQASSQFHGTMYNSLSTGAHARGTFSSFISDMTTV